MENKCVKTAILRNFYDIDASNEEKLSAIGMNTGNLVYWEAIDRLFKPDRISYNETEKLKNYDNVIITDLIWIRENSTYEYLEKLVDQYNIPFIPMSIGLQSPNFDPNFKLSDELVRLLKKLEKRATLGLRGYYTAQILNKYGITNYSVIGCPSMYYWNNPNLKISDSRQPRNISSNFKTFYGDLSRTEKHFLSYCAGYNAQFVEQTNHKFKLEQVKDNKYFNYVNKWISNASVCYYTYNDWSKGLKDIDFSFGGRFHGNVIALHNNIKSLFITSDSRTKEMTDLFELPSINMNEFDKNKSIDYYYKLANYSKFNAKYPLLFKNFVEFALKNGLEFNMDAQPLDFIPKIENVNEKNVGQYKKLNNIKYTNEKTIEIKLKKEGNRITYDLNVLGPWEICFYLNDKFFVEFEQNIEHCPDSVAIIPALSVILPVSWVENATIIIDDIDEDFYECIENIKDNYRFMMPKIRFEGKLIAKKITLNNVNHVAHNTLCLYSGGVDAMFTLLHNVNYKPSLLTIWGTDIPIDAVDAWERVKKQNEESARNFNLPITFVKSSFRRILNESYLTSKYASLVNDNWWHALEHGLALLGMVAPYAYLNNISDIKIASSFSSKDYEKIVCASLPHIDENVKFCGCNIYHDGFYMDRLDKIKYIVNYHNKHKVNIKLRVCWQEVTGENCCKCEKCARTIYALIGLGENPEDYGFALTYENKQALTSNLNTKFFTNNVFWKSIKELINKNYEKLKDNELVQNLLKD